MSEKEKRNNSILYTPILLENLFSQYFLLHFFLSLNIDCIAWDFCSPTRFTVDGSYTMYPTLNLSSFFPVHNCTKKKHDRFIKLVHINLFISSHYKANWPDSVMDCNKRTQRFCTRYKSIFPHSLQNGQLLQDFPKRFLNFIVHFLFGLSFVSVKSTNANLCTQIPWQNPV